MWRVRGRGRLDLWGAKGSMGQAFDDQPRSWGPLFSGLPRREGPVHTALLDFLEQNRARALAALPGAAAEIAGNEGFETMLGVVRTRGGRRVYVSADPDRCAGALGVSVGPRTHRRMLEGAVGSGLIEVPSAWGVFVALRGLAIEEALRAGATDVAVAQEFGVTTRALRKRRART